MTARMIDGRALARRVRAEIAEAVQGLPSPPGLATVLVGDDPASAIYVRSKRQQCVDAGMLDMHHHVPGDVSQGALEGLIDELAADRQVSGILVQLPLPRHLDVAAVIARIPPGKDVDGLTEVSAGRLAAGRPGLRPCTPSGVMRLLEHAGVSLAGAEAVVVGRSTLVGTPLAHLLVQANATVTVCHSRTRDLASVTRRADVLVAAAGVPRLIGADGVKPGATVIDVGIHRAADGISGDVDARSVAPVAAALTPVPGGVGPMTVAMLLWNTLAAARHEI
jgi:methylenetetrahydrofolate dehydrogenase (NADP+)/methenyltetrahydrofolate cyclohydrolase